jgi:hypothetical protein
MKQSQSFSEQIGWGESLVMAAFIQEELLAQWPDVTKLPG